MNEKFYSVICEREKDKSIIDTAQELYFDIIKNFNTSKNNNNVIEVNTKTGIFYLPSTRKPIGFSRWDEWWAT